MTPSRSAPLRGAVLLLAVLLAGGCGEKGPKVDDILAAAAVERSKGNNGAAIIHLKNAVQKAPEHADARYLLGIAYLDAGDNASAEKELRRALELKADPANVTVPLARALLGIGEFQKVLDQTESAAGQGKNQGEILALRGMANLGLKREKEAQALFEQALAKQPEQVDALLGLARLAVAGKRMDEASALVERAVKSTPASVEARLMKADLDRVQNKGDPEQDYKKVIELNADNIAARLNLITMQIGKNNLPEAEKLLAEAKKVAPRNPLLKYMEALIEFRKKNYTGARDAVLQVLKVAPNHPPSVLLAGAVEYALGSHVQAQTYLTSVIERAPGNLYARKLLVASLAKTGQTQRAQEVLGPGLKQAPGDPALLNMAGELAMQGNDFTKAREYFDKAAKADPKSAGARTGLAVSELAAGNADAGLADLETAVQLDTDRYQADILLITTHMQKGRFDQALKAAQTLEKKQPKNPLTYNLKAAAYLGKKDVKAARAELERALEIQPTYLPAAMNLAQLDLQDKNPQAARKRIEGVLEKDPNNVQALISLASLGPRLGATPKEQVDWLERAGRAAPGTVQPALMLARYYAQTGDTKKALTVAQQAAAAHPNNPEVIEALGAIQMAAGEKNQALSTYSKLTQLQPKSPTALYRLAIAQSMNEDAKGAEASLRTALEAKPNFIEAQVFMVDLQTRAQRYSEAAAIARQVQKQAPKSPVGYVLEGDVSMAEKKFPQAAKSYETAFGMGKSSIVAMKLHAALVRSGKQEEADARLAQWIKGSPDDMTARLYAADVALKGGKLPVAIEQYELVLKKQPENIVVLNNLAWSYQQMKDPRALATAETAYKLKPDNPAVADTLGWILVEQGNAARGVPILQKAVAAAPKAPEIRYHLAQGLLKSGDKSGARNELERLLSGDAKFPQYDEALKLLKELRQ